jgi:hypothetical protein
VSDRDRPKKSWKELDAQRDRGGGRARSERGGPRSQEDPRASRQHRAALDALFAKGELGKLAEKLAPAARPMAPSRPAILSPPSSGEPGAPGAIERSAPTPAPTPAAPEPPKDDARSVLRKKILEAPSRDAISRAYDRYEKQYGAPRDFELLEQGLEHVKPDRIVEVIGQIEALLEREKPRRSRTLAGKLRLIEETSDDRELRERAAKLRARL